MLRSLTGVKLYQSDADKLFSVMGSMVEASIKPKAARETFYSDVEKDGFYKAAKKYSKVTLVDIAKEKAKPIRYFFKKNKS